MAGTSAQTAPMSVRGKLQLGVPFALLLVYLIWGSTYLGIRVADETLPPLLMAGGRFLIAGVALYVGCRIAGVKNPSGRQWFSAGVVGTFLLVGGNGTVVVVEQFVPSGITALFVALVPLWTVVLLWARRNGTRPSARTLVGVTLGLVGVGLLVLHGGGAGGQSLNPVALLLVLSTGAWAWGSIYSQRAPLPESPLMSTAVEMLVGGAILLLMGVVAGEPASLAHRTISARSISALAYLIVFGSLVAYTAFTWLLKHASAALVSTYAYANPVVAVLLGALILHEALSVWTIVSAAIIITAVVLITLPMRRRRVTAEPAQATQQSAHAFEDSGELPMATAESR